MSDDLYRVEVQGGGSFLYDLIDVGRFAQRMATEGDRRAFSIAPAYEFADEGRLMPVPSTDRGTA